MDTGESNCKNKIVCSGALFYSKKTHRILLLQKASGKYSGVWGLVGGTNLESENPWQGLCREINEEIGNVDIIKSVPLETFVSNDLIFNFYTFLCVVENEFIPILSDEHSGWGWVSISQPPHPLHPGLKYSFGNKTTKIKLETMFELINVI